MFHSNQDIGQVDKSWTDLVGISRGSLFEPHHTQHAVDSACSQLNRVFRRRTAATLAECWARAAV